MPRGLGHWISPPWNLRERAGGLSGPTGLGAGFVVLVRDTDLLLRGEPDQVPWFRESMDFYAEEWAPTVFGTAYQFGSDSEGTFASELAVLRYPDTTHTH